MENLEIFGFLSDGPKDLARRIPIFSIFSLIFFSRKNMKTFRSTRFICMKILASFTTIRSSNRLDRLRRIINCSRCCCWTVVLKIGRKGREHATSNRAMQRVPNALAEVNTRFLAAFLGQDKSWRPLLARDTVVDDFRKLFRKHKKIRVILGENYRGSPR